MGCQLESQAGVEWRDAGGEAAGAGADAGSSGAATAADFLAVSTLQQTDAVLVEKVQYMSGGLRVFGIVCRPVDAVARPVLVVNHGGFEGIAPGEVQGSGMCLGGARNGLVVIEAGYRGEPLFTGSTQDVSEGSVEVCLGEVDDVQNLMRIVRRMPYSDATRFAAYGGSHGGCITEQLALREPSLRAAVDFAGPTDLRVQWRWWQSQLAGGESSQTCPDSTSCEAVHRSLVSLLQQATGGTPDGEPDAYAARSPYDRLGALSVPMLFVHGADDYVVNADQTCLKRSKLLAAGFEPRAWYLLDDLSASNATELCQGGFLDTPAPDPAAPDSWLTQRALFVIYRGQGHGFSANSPAATHASTLALSFLAAHLAQ